MLRDHDDRDDADAEYNKELLDPTSSSLSLTASRQTPHACLPRLVLLVLFATCILLSLLGGAMLENVGHVVPLGTERASSLLENVGTNTTSSDDILKWVKSASANSFRGKSTRARYLSSPFPKLCLVGQAYTDNMQPGVRYLTTWNYAGMSTLSISQVLSTTSLTRGDFQPTTSWAM